MTILTALPFLIGPFHAQLTGVKLCASKRLKKASEGDSLQL